MAQLTDDCFAFDGPLMPIADATRLMTAQVPVRRESMMLLSPGIFAPLH